LLFRGSEKDGKEVIDEVKRKGKREKKRKKKKKSVKEEASDIRTRARVVQKKAAEWKIKKNDCGRILQWGRLDYMEISEEAHTCLLTVHSLS